MTAMGDVLETFQVSLGDVLAFATGASAIPPMGLNATPAIKFHTTSPFPLANTCANTLSLPLLSHTHESFKYNFCYGICNAGCWTATLRRLQGGAGSGRSLTSRDIR